MHICGINSHSCNAAVQLSILSLRLTAVITEQPLAYIRVTAYMSDSLQIQPKQIRVIEEDECDSITKILYSAANRHPMMVGTLHL